LAFPHGRTAARPANHRESGRGYRPASAHSRRSRLAKLAS
jgi:hypothetical protein